jgi:hypothetical protein
MRTDVRTDGHDEANESHLSQFCESVSEIFQLERNSDNTNKMCALEILNFSSCTSISSSLSFAFV